MTTQLTAEQIKVAREWCCECWPEQEDEIMEASDAVIERTIARKMDGGIEELIRIAA